MEITAYGKDKLPAGPDIEHEEELILVEGRADVVNLLKHGFKNVVAMNGTSVTDTIKELSKQKEITLFVDGDRGGDMIIKEMLATCDVDFITKAPDGKEVEELQKKEIHQSIRSKASPKDWAKKNKGSSRQSKSTSKSSRSRQTKSSSRKDNNNKKSDSGPARKPKITDEEKAQYTKLFKEVKGKDSAYLLDKNHAVLGKVSTSDLAQALPNLDGVYAVIMGGEVSGDVARAVDKTRPRHVVAAKEGEKMRSALITPEDLK